MRTCMSLVYRVASHRESVGQLPTVSVTVSYPARREIRAGGRGCQCPPGENRLGAAPVRCRLGRQRSPVEYPGDQAMRPGGGDADRATAASGAVVPFANVPPME